MKNFLRNEIPLVIETEDELRQLWAKFKDYELREEIGYVPDNAKRNLTGAGLFVDFLCGIKPKKRTGKTSYLRYPDDLWPLD